jgi:hypothetical protein
MFAFVAATPVLSSEVGDAWISQLRIDGFQVYNVRNTFLGRLKIYAVRDGMGREVVINPYTGEVFRDHTRAIDVFSLQIQRSDDYKFDPTENDPDLTGNLDDVFQDGIGGSFDTPPSLTDDLPGSFSGGTDSKNSRPDKVEGFRDRPKKGRNKK